MNWFLYDRDLHQEKVKNSLSEDNLLPCLLLLPAPSAPRIKKEYEKKDCKIYRRSKTCSIIISWEPPEQINAKKIRHYRIKYTSTEMASKVCNSSVTELEINNLSK